MYEVLEILSSIRGGAKDVIDVMLRHVALACCDRLAGALGLKSYA